MTKKDASETINNIDSLTIGNVFQLVRKLKLSAILSMAALFSSLLGGAYAIGKSSTQKDTAVMLQTPFSMSYKNHTTDFTAYRLILVKDPTAVPPEKGMMVLSLRQIKTEFDVAEVGKIIAKDDQEELSWPWSMFAESEVEEDRAVAMTKVDITLTSAWNFNWNGHLGDYNFTEKFVSEDTVNRFYSDGCVLEYKVDADRRSIPDTFKWLKSVH